MDILAANRLGRAFYSQMFDSTHGPANTARFVLLDPRATSFYLGLSDLVGELSTQSELFRTRWAAHNVRYHDTGVKRFHHPVVDDLTLSFETMTLTGDSSLTMFAFTAEAGSKSEEALNLLASWTATLDPMELPNVTDRA